MKNEFTQLRNKLSKKTFFANAIEKFGQDVFNKIFDMAWGKGHADGDDSIESELVDLVSVLNLVK